MNSELLIFEAVVILFLAIFFVVFIQVRKLKKNMNSENWTGGSSIMAGNFVCRSWKAPTIGRKPEFDYGVSLAVNKESFHGEYRYPSGPGAQKLIYSGELFLTYHQGFVKGGSKRKAVEGMLNPSQGNLILGFSGNSIFRWLNSPFQFRVENGRLRFVKTDNGQGSIGEGSTLEIGDERITGRLEHSKGSWVIDVDVRFDDAPKEIAILSILFMANEILIFHHD